MFSSMTSKYEQIPNEEGEKHPSSFVNVNRSTITRQVLLISACFVAGILGFFAAQRASRLESTPGGLDFKMEPHVFQYNRSFSYPPSNITNRAWRDIFPQEGGFFIHPTIAPTRSTFSVFHQLHCLNGLRGGYWANQQAANRGHKLTDDDLPVDIQQSHMRHCIDLLRQVLMCHGDTTLEVVDETINGVHGFRTEHQCKNWDQLKQWTSEQQLKQHVEQIV